jgi:hypothetical protein
MNPYPPDINQAEQIQRRTKYVGTTNICPMNIEVLMKNTCAALEAPRQPELFLSFFNHAGLLFGGNGTGRLIN